MANSIACLAGLN